MRRKTEKGVRKRVFIMIGAVLAMLLTAGYWNINQRIPQAVVEDVNIGGTLEFQDGVMISVDSYRFLSDKEQQLYEEVGFNTIHESKLLEVNLTLENMTAESKQIIMSDMYVEGIGISNGIPKMITDASEGHYSGNLQELQPGEKKQVCYPYEILHNQVSQKEWGDITEREFWLTFSSYPVKKKLLLS